MNQMKATVYFADVLVSRLLAHSTFIEAIDHVDTDSAFESQFIYEHAESMAWCR